MRKEAALHSKLLAAAARDVLGPLGLFQKGRSRTWLDDRGWWLCVVEFQPSSYSRGSYLNVGCMWLWRVKDYISFDEGHRVEGFAEFRDEAQFAAVAKSLAERAALEVLRYRELFASVHKVCAYYVQHQPNGLWPTFHAAVACALDGRSRGARQLFQQITDAKEDDATWTTSARAEARKLCAIAGDVPHFRDVVAESVRRARAIAALPDLASLRFD
jgi:hypothetical protein